MPKSGRVAFGKMDAVVFGKPAADTLAPGVESRLAPRSSELAR